MSDRKIMKFLHWVNLATTFCQNLTFSPFSCGRQYWCWKNHIFEKFRQIFKISRSDTWTCTKMARRQGSQFVREILSRTKTMVYASTDLCSTDNGSKSQPALYKTHSNHGKINVKASPNYRVIGNQSADSWSPCKNLDW